jgi:ABC-type Zn2+ transport system substrate-binding protein/surface adhesin
MKTMKTTFHNKHDAATVEQPNHMERIKSQVLAKIGNPLRLDRVEVSRHHSGNYRVNIWQQPEPSKNIAVTLAPRIGQSYFLTVSDTGEIINSNPPLPQLGSSA